MNFREKSRQCADCREPLLYGEATERCTLCHATCHSECTMEGVGGRSFCEDCSSENVIELYVEAGDEPRAPDPEVRN